MPRALAQDHQQDVAPLGAERHADADFRVRFPVEKDMTPYSPIVAIARAASPKATNSVPKAR